MERGGRVYIAGTKETLIVLQERGGKGPIWDVCGGKKKSDDLRQEKSVEKTLRELI